MMEGNHLFLIFYFQLEPPIKKGEHMRFGGSKVPPSFDRCSHQNDRSAVAFLDHHCLCVSLISSQTSPRSCSCMGI